jgi:hypothetical protein
VFYPVGYLMSLLLLCTLPSTKLRSGHDPAALNAVLSQQRFRPRVLSLVAVGTIAVSLLGP